MSSKDYIANGPISGPKYIPGVQADVDLNGMKFSYKIGVFFTPETEENLITLPQSDEMP